MYKHFHASVKFKVNSFSFAAGEMSRTFFIIILFRRTDARTDMLEFIQNLTLIINIYILWGLLGFVLGVANVLTKGIHPPSLGEGCKNSKIEYT